MKTKIITAILVIGFATVCFSQRLEITKQGSNEKISVDLSGIGEAGGASVFLQTLRADLKRSGWFMVNDNVKGVVSVSGNVVASGGYLTFRCNVDNRVTGKRYFARTYNEKFSETRRMAHLVADDIVEAVKQVKGIAASSIVMIGSQGGKKDIYTCDYDGANLLRITREGAVCLSPSWGPEGRTIVYTSFYGGFPDVYKIDLGTNQRKKIAGYSGLNTGADISPDGKSMALTLSKDGNPDLYLKNLSSGFLTRLTRTQYAAEASPSWSPDGRQIVFVSDKTRRPHLYITNTLGEGDRKVTFSGDENVAPDWGPDGRIVYSSKRSGKYHICITDPRNNATFQLTSDYADYEDPSWAPDGRHIVCSRTEGYSSQIYILDTLGDPPVRLLSIGGDWYSPDWSK